MISRKKFLQKNFLGVACLVSFQNLLNAKASRDSTSLEGIKISLNAYSFNHYLQNGSMDLDNLISYCTKLNFDAVDLTGYYFLGYPSVPDDDYIFHIKRSAFIRGLEISGTGIRNNFTDPDPENRRAAIKLIKNWIRVASKLGAPVIRVFAGQEKPDGIDRNEVDSWVSDALKECVNFGKNHGVMIGLQNHNDYLKNSDHVLEIIKLVDSEWFGIILDIGSFSTKDPYEDIYRVAPYAVSWQIKENLGYRDKTVKVNLEKIVQILRDVNYRGYIPIETLGGDPKVKVPRFLEEVRTAIG